MNMAIVIPAQETNKYHKLGDLAPFGDTSLLEWKISQCKENFDGSNIYISSDSELIKNIAFKEGVNFIERDKDQSYIDSLMSTVYQVEEDAVVWINVTSPFLTGAHYKKMYEQFVDTKSSIVSVSEKREYVFYKDEKLNFSNEFVSRSKIEPIYIMTNGCYITSKSEILKNKSLVGNSPSFYLLDTFASTEIKDIEDYSIARDMISIFFKREING